MKVKFIKNIYENGMNYKIGDIANLKDKRAEALAKTGFVTILEKKEKKKAVKHSPKDKMIYKAKNK